MCGLSRDLATAAAAALTISISCLPIRPRVSDAIVAPPVPTQQFHPHPHTAMVQTVSHTISNPLAVVGVGKAAIHDYSTPPLEQSPYTASRSINATSLSVVSQKSLHDQNLLDNDLARREFALAVRLVTAVLLGVMLGVERRATRLNLGVRSITLISLSSAIVSLMVTGADVTGLPVALVAAPWLPIVGVAGVTGMLVYIAARVRRRATKHVTSMSWVVGTGVAMGGACGAGLSLLTVICYLVAVGIMRGNNSGRSSRARKPIGRHSSPDDENMRRRQARDPLVNVSRGDGMDGSGFSA